MERKKTFFPNGINLNQKLEMQNLCINKKNQL